VTVTTTPAQTSPTPTPAAKPTIKTTSVDMNEFVLYTGDGTREYCAFPSILELDDGNILVVWKQGFAHMAEEGITNYAVMEKSGRIREMGTAAAVEGFNTQNAELTRLADGRILMWLDIQDYKNKKTRTGTIVYEYRDGKFVKLDGILTDTEGTKYGYEFDGLTWQGKDWMIAMTFPELGASRTVRLLTTTDGKSWTKLADLNELLDAPVNESSFAVMDEKLYVFARGDNNIGHLAVLDADGKLIKKHSFTEAEGIYKTGRPKLFVRDGALWGIMRNHAGSETMRLDLIRFDAEKLAVDKIYSLEAAGIKTSGDGYYAEQYFDGNDLCVITYKPTAEGGKPNIVLLRTPWNNGNPGSTRVEIALEGAKKRSASSDQGNLVIHLPDGWDGESMVLALHGSGRGTQSYDEVPFYIRQKELALGEGYAFAILQNMQDTYGTDIGYHNVCLAAEELLTNWTHGEKLTLWATSAGGVGMYRYAAEHAENVRALIGTFAVFDTEKVFPVLASCRKAWGADGKTAEEIAKIVEGKNPGKMLDALRGIPIYLAHGTADKSVPIELSAQIAADELGAFLHRIEGGVHGLEDYRYYDEAPLRALRDDMDKTTETMEFPRRIIIDNDGADSQCGEGTYEAFCAQRMKDYEGLGATTLYYTTRSSGFGVFTHKTQYGTIFTTNLPHFKKMNAVSEMIARGEDTLTYALRYAREHGLEFFWQMRMNDTHDGTGAVYSTYNFYSNGFKFSHPECLMGQDGKKPKYCTATAVNYAMPLVREMACKYVEEVCQNYDIDGIQLDFFRHLMLFPRPAEGYHASAQEIAMLTEMMHEMRAIVDREGERRGRKILLSVRVPDSVEYALFLGMDIEDWLASGLIDILTTASYLQLNNFDYVAELGHRYGVPVYPSLDESRVKDAEAKSRRYKKQVTAARAELALSQGCDGVLLYNYYNIHGTSAAAEDAKEAVRIISDPAALSAADKTFFASVLGRGSVSGGAPPHDEYMNIPQLNPAHPITVDGKGTLTMRLPEKGEAQTARLQLWFGKKSSGTVYLNGTKLGVWNGETAYLTIPAALLTAGDNEITVESNTPVQLTDAAVYFTH